MMLTEETSLDQLTLPVADFQKHLRLGTGFTETSLQLPVLEGFLAAAIASLEARTGKVLLQRVFRWQIHQWPSTREVCLPLAPVRAVLSVETVDEAGMATPADPSRYWLKADDARPVLVAKGAGLPPVPTSGVARIRLEAGMAESFAALPRDLAQAVMLLAAHYYENRAATDLPAGDMPFGVASLVERYKTVRLFAGRAS